MNGGEKATLLGHSFGGFSLCFVRVKHFFRSAKAAAATTDGVSGHILSEYYSSIYFYFFTPHRSPLSKVQIIK